MSFVKNTYFGRHKHTWKCSQIKNTHTYKIELQLASFHACKSSDTNLRKTSGRPHVMWTWNDTYSRSDVMLRRKCERFSGWWNILSWGKRHYTTLLTWQMCKKTAYIQSHFLHNLHRAAIKAKVMWCSGWFRSGNRRSKMGHRIWSVIHTLAVRLTTCQTDHILLWRSILASDVNHEVHNMDSFSGLVCLSVAS